MGIFVNVYLITKVRFNYSLLPSFSTFHKNKNLHHISYIQHVDIANLLIQLLGYMISKVQKGSKEQANDKN